METVYLESIRRTFEFYKTLGEKTLSQVPDASLAWQFNEDSNSIVTIVKHLHGNMLSRWTDFLTTDGEKDWRERDGEFENEQNSREQLMKLWNEGWTCLFTVLDSLTADDVLKTVYIRNQGHTVTDALNRQLAHYSYHVGQIVFLGKMIVGTEWNSLSIPKGQSKTYNAGKFAQEKHIEHFTQEFIDQNKKHE